MDFCLGHAARQAAELEYVVFYEKPLVKLRRVLATSFATAPKAADAFSRSMSSFLGERLSIRRRLARHTGVDQSRVLFVDHHLSHAASAFLSSPFDEAAILTIDGVGEWKTATLGRGAADWTGGGRNELEASSGLMFPHSLGLLYSAFTAYLGFEVNEGEYKVMGMAPYGTPRYVDEVRRTVRVFEDGSFWLDMGYFSWHHSLRRPYESRLEELFGRPARDPRAGFRPELEADRFYADVAASIQAVTEEIVLSMAREAHRRTGSRRLCLAGGVALNGMATGRLLAETPFEELFIPPAPGDSGGALGAALYAHHVLLGRRREFTLEHAYWGAEYDADATVGALEATGMPYDRLENDELIERVTDGLLAGKVVGWCQGRFEFGPRALGNRSILADPRHAEMKERINAKIKFREPFRPFAPAVLEARVGEYVDGPEPHQPPARFMLMVLPLRADRREELAAVNHMGTARVQTVRREWNERFYDLVRTFGERTGTPVLLNTSFNLRGEPIVSTPAEALSTFERSDLDLLVLGDVVVTKEER
jgi:carbamoyltransferase